MSLNPVWTTPQPILPPAARRLAGHIANAAAQAWSETSTQSIVSAAQQEVYETLADSGRRAVLEHSTPDGLFCIDIALFRPSAHHPKLRIALEVDGDQHFTSTPPHLPLGPTLARWRSLQRRGWCVVSVRTRVWAAAGGPEEKAALLARALDSAVARGPGSLVDNVNWSPVLMGPPAAPRQRFAAPWVTPAWWWNAYRRK